MTQESQKLIGFSSIQIFNSLFSCLGNLYHSKHTKKFILLTSSVSYHYKVSAATGGEKKSNKKKADRNVILFPDCYNFLTMMRKLLYLQLVGIIHNYADIPVFSLLNGLCKRGI